MADMIAYHTHMDEKMYRAHSARKN